LVPRISCDCIVPGLLYREHKVFDICVFVDSAVTYDGMVEIVLEKFLFCRYLELRGIPSVLASSS